MPVPMMFAITMAHAVKKPIVRRGFTEAPGLESGAVVELRGRVTGVIVNPLSPARFHSRGRLFFV